MMDLKAPPQLESPAWYYTRMLFARGVPGRLALHGTRLTFANAPAVSVRNDWYEKAGKSGDVTFDLDVSSLESISYNWLTASLVIKDTERKHIVCFASPPEHRTAADAVALVKACQTLRRWQTTLTT